MFREQQEKLRALMDGMKSITVPVDGDAAAVSKFQTAYEALRKKARGWVAPRVAAPPAPGSVFNRWSQP